MILKSVKERTRFYRFAAVGAIGAIVDFCILNLLLTIGTNYVVAGSISFLAAVLNNFLWNRYWTYPDSRSKKIGSQLLQFGIINGIGLAIRIPMLAALEHFLIGLANNYASQIPLSPRFLGHNIGLAMAILIVMLWNYLANRYWTYNDVSG